MEDTIEYYLSKGFDRKMAEYFASGRKRIVAVTPNDDYTLTLRFDNGEMRIFDVAPILQPNSVFAPLRNLNDFRRVYLDEDHAVSWDIDPTIDSTRVWSNKINLCPDTCYVDSRPFYGGDANV